MKQTAWIAILAALSTVSLSATIVQYENRGLWQTTVGSISSTTTFDGVVADNGELYLLNPLMLEGNTYTRGNGYSWVIGPDITTIPPGLYDWNSGVVGVYGDQATLQITFAQPVLAFGMDFGAFSPGPGSATFGGEARIMLPDGSFVVREAETAKRLRFLGLISNTPFSSVTLTGLGTVVFDDVSLANAPVESAVPEPGSLALVGGTLVAGAGWMRRRGAQG